MIINTIYNNTIIILVTLWVMCTVLCTQGKQQAIPGDNTHKKDTLKLYQEKEINHPLDYPAHNEYIDLMLKLGKYQEAEQYVKKCIKSNTEKVFYQLDWAWILMKKGKIRAADKNFNTTIRKYIGEDHQVRTIINYFIAHRLFDKARYTIDVARDTRSNNSLYAFEMGSLYRMVNDKQAMIKEYINYFMSIGWKNMDYMKNLFQRTLSEDGDMDMLEKVIYEYAQHYPDVEFYPDMLIWVNLQQLDFYNAYLRAKAFDRRFTHDGSKTLTVAEIALGNNDFEQANEAYSHVFHQYPDTDNAMKAQLGIVIVKRDRLKNNPNATITYVRSLIQDYQSLIDKYPYRSAIYEVVIDQAHLYAYRLNEQQEAIRILNTLIASKTVPASVRARAELELGNIYVLIEEPWEAALLYAQVAREQGDSPVGYLAKLYSAKLYYYQGDFDLAQAQLDILKEATTREIANDAMELSLRIRENTAEDSTGIRLKAYAGIELLLEGDREAQALEAMDQLKRECEESADHASQYDPILDDLYWLEARIRLKRNEWQKAYALLQKITAGFGQDVLADDALFLQAEILDNYRGEKKKAMDAYLDFINRFPGSIYITEARNRYRKLNKAQEVSIPVSP